MRVAITADHNGIALKGQLSEWLVERGHDVDDRAADVGDETVHYPPLCEDVCRRVLAGDADFAIVVGGSGSGEAICCNKLPGIRAALCHSVWTAEIGRGNNDANVLVVGAKIVDATLAAQILETWLATAFRGEPHATRLAMIASLERGESLLQERQ
jgi:ribose 5-phosphate isomerase B